MLYLTDMRYGLGDTTVVVCQDTARLLDAGQDNSSSLQNWVYQWDVFLPDGYSCFRFINLIKQ